MSEDALCLIIAISFMCGAIFGIVMGFYFAAWFKE